MKDNATSSIAIFSIALFNFIPLDILALRYKIKKASKENIIFNITTRVQSDWNQDNETAPDYIKNKPIEETEDDAMKMLIDMGIIDPVTDEENNIFTDENGNILTI